MEKESQQKPKAKGVKFYYDQEEGVFVKNRELSLNWMASEILKIPGAQITKITNEEVEKFINILFVSDMRMPNGQHSLIWMKERLGDRHAMAKEQKTEAWENTANRYGYILYKLDMVLAGIEDKEELMKIKKPEEEIKLNRTPNNMVARFEPLEDD